jgi:small-conductance mechanosensitive channel
VLATLPTPEKVFEEVSNPESWRGWAGQVGRAFLVLAIAWLLTRISKWTLARLRRYTIRILDRRHEGVTLDMEKRARTLTTALRKTLDVIVWTFAVVIALRELSFNIEPLLAGLGIAGIAVGLGAQTLIKDWLGGFFLLMEDQIRIGDVVVINEIAGMVEEIDLRTTVLRGDNGAVHVITNGSITALSNLTREYSYYVLDITVAQGTNLDRALAIIQSVGAGLYNDGKYRPLILSSMELLGVEKLSDRGVLLRARMKTLPGKQLEVGRELNRRAVIRLKEEGISFPQWLPPPAP